MGAQMAPPPASRTTRTLRTRPHSLSLAFAPAPRARRFLLVGGKRGLAAPRNAVVADMELNLDIKKVTLKRPQISFSQNYGIKGHIINHN